STNRISLKMFYLRRTFRIFPCAYTYILVMFLLYWTGQVALGRNDFLHAFTYTVNYEKVRPWYLIHLWSLSVEEQFYFLWPAILLILRPRRGLWFAASVLLLAPLARLGMWYLTPELRWNIGAGFQTNADALAAGCVLAGIRPWLWAQPAYLRFQKSRAFLLVPVLAALGAALLYASRPPLLLVSYLMGQTVLNIAIALSIDWCVRHDTSPLGRFLNWKPMVFVGVLSYSLYLWQEPFLNRLSDAVINRFPLNLVLAFLAALASYYLVEKPFLNLRRRVENWLARPRADVRASTPGRAADAFAEGEAD
ncbi:MAG TPA: acyltransferase, partial [Bryobacteraceae bacterium]|nr:acyltransferase [Bryobacteraceae bacterium]